MFHRNNKQKQVTIVGGGVIGLCCAYYLTKAGFNVCVLEQQQFNKSCATVSAGYISPSHFVPLAHPGAVAKGLKWMFDKESPFYLHPQFDMNLWRWFFQFCRHCNHTNVSRFRSILLDLCQRSKQSYLTLAQALRLPFDLEEQGIYILANSAKGFDEELATLKTAQQMGLEAFSLSSEDLKLRMPELELAIEGGVFYRDDAHVNPNKLVDALVAELRDLRVELVEQCRVEKLITKNSRVTGLQTTQGKYSVEDLVVASGSWSQELGKHLSISIPIQPGKGYSLTTENPWPSIKTPMILHERAVAITPLKELIRFAGTLEFNGHRQGIEARRVDGILKSTKRYINNFERSMVNTNNAQWGFRPCTPDGMPLIGALSKWKNVSIAAGHAMLGVTLAPITGQLIAYSLSRESNDKSLCRLLNAVRPERFG